MNVVLGVTDVAATGDSSFIFWGHQCCMLMKVINHLSFIDLNLHFFGSCNR